MGDKKYPIPYKKGSIYFQYSVKDFDRAKKFYSEVLGFEKTWDGGAEAGWAEFALPAKGAMLGLNLLREGEVKHSSARGLARKKIVSPHNRHEATQVGFDGRAGVR